VIWRLKKRKHSKRKSKILQFYKNMFLTVVTLKFSSPHSGVLPKSYDKECVIKYLKENFLFVMDPYIQTFLFVQLLFPFHYVN